MGFPRRLLNEGEEIAYDLRPHWWYFLQPGIVAIGVVALLVGVLRLDGDLRAAGLWVFAAAAGSWAVWSSWELLKWRSTHFVVTSDRLVFRSGVLTRHGREIPLERVDDVTFRQSLWERIIGTGDLLVESAGEQDRQRFTDIPHPETVCQEIYRRIEAREARRARGTARRSDASVAPAAPAAPPAPGVGGAARAPGAPGDATEAAAAGAAASIPQQIRELAELRDQGIVSQEEFEAKKRELLDRM